MTVAVPSCYFQIDLVVGPVLERVGPPSDYYRQRQIDEATGGTAACASASDPPAAPSPGAAELYRTFVGWVAR